MNKNEIDRVTETIDEMLERAAKYLPKGFTITIDIEKDGYNVSLTKPNGFTIVSIDGGDGLRSDINEGICIANGFTSA